jgi:hypothetical protein
MNLLIFPVSGRVPARQPAVTGFTGGPAVTGFTGGLPSLDSPGSLPAPDLIRHQKGKTKQ